MLSIKTTVSKWDKNEIFAQIIFVLKFKYKFYLTYILELWDKNDMLYLKK
jgi:hypothetical protein